MTPFDFHGVSEAISAVPISNPLPGFSLPFEEMGHEIRDRPPIGRVDAILALPDGRLEGGADPRGEDTASGF